jgi:hypothetical protein
MPIALFAGLSAVIVMMIEQIYYILQGKSTDICRCYCVAR